MRSWSTVKGQQNIVMTAGHCELTVEHSEGLLQHFGEEMELL